MNNESLLDAGLAAMRSADYEEAIGRFTEARATGINCFELLMPLGDALLQMSRAEEAAAVFEDVVNNDLSTLITVSFDAHCNLGLAYCRLGRYTEALEQYSLASELIQNNVSLYCRRGEVYRDLNLYDKSVSILEEAIHTGIREPRIYLELGRTYMMAKKYLLAEKALNEAKILAPDYPAVYVELGHLAGAREDYHKSLQYYQIAKKMEPDDANDPLIRASIARILVALKKYSEARDIYSQILGKYPKYPDAHFGLAAAEMGLRNVGAAIQEFQAGLEVGRADLNVLSTLFHLQLRTFRLRDALQTMRRAGTEIKRLRSASVY